MIFFKKTARKSCNSRHFCHLKPTQKCPICILFVDIWISLAYNQYIHLKGRFLSVRLMKKSECSVQIGDALVGFFPNKHRLLNVPYYNQSEGNSFNFCSLHSHIYAELFACNKGTVTIRTPHKSIKLNRGEVAVIPAGIMHTKLDDNDNCEWASVGILCTECRTVGEVGLFERISAVVYIDEISVFHPKNDIFEAMSKIYEKGSSRITLSDKFCFASEFCSLLSQEGTSAAKPEGCRKISKPDIDRLMKLDLIINSRYMLDLTNKQLADDLFLSERQLSRFVKRHYGIPLHTLISNKRVSVAADLLFETDDTVEQIAEKVGFGGKTGFYREFQKLHGQTPLQYRKCKKA